MDEPRRWIIGLIAVAALLGLLLLARGEPDGGRGDPAAAFGGGAVELQA
jgi:preprotein translocase subunit SecG